MKHGSWETIKSPRKSLEGIWRVTLRIATFSYMSSELRYEPKPALPRRLLPSRYAAHAENYWNMLSVPAAADSAIGNGSSREMILVLPDAFTVNDGSMFSNSLTTAIGGVIADDLVSYIDAHYRTIPDRGAEGSPGIPWVDMERCGSA